MKTFKTFLQEHPKLMIKYVSTGTYIVDRTLYSLHKLMTHLLVVQNIDPNSQPGEKYRQALAMAVDKIDAKDFDDDYDFSWVKKCFEKTKEQLSNMHLSRKQYWNLTNISMLESPPEINDMPKECEKRELKITPPKLKEGFIKFGDLDTLAKSGDARKKTVKSKSAKKPIKIKKVSTDYSKKEINEQPEKPAAVAERKPGVFRRVSS